MQGSKKPLTFTSTTGPRYKAQALHVMASKQLFQRSASAGSATTASASSSIKLFALSCYPPRAVAERAVAPLELIH